MKKIINKIDNLIKTKANFINKYNEKGTIYLYGKAITDIIDNKDAKELSFIILSQEDIKLNKYLEKNNIKYIEKKSKYQIYIDDITINIYIKNDLLDIEIDSNELIYYDVKEHILIPFGSRRLLSYYKNNNKEYITNLKIFNKNILKTYK